MSDFEVSNPFPIIPFRGVPPIVPGGPRIPDPGETLSVRQIGFTGIQKGIEKVMTLPERRATMERVLRALGNDIVRALKPATPTGATSRMRNSSRFTVQVRPNGIGELRGILDISQPSTSPFNSFPYQPIVQFGRRPGRTPNSEFLRSWVLIKLGVSGLPGRRLAYVIARSIGRHGTHPNDYFQTTLYRMRGRIDSASYQLGQEFLVGMTGHIETYQRGQGSTFLF